MTDSYLFAFNNEDIVKSFDQIENIMGINSSQKPLIEDSLPKSLTLNKSPLNKFQKMNNILGKNFNSKIKSEDQPQLTLLNQQNSISISNKLNCKIESTSSANEERFFGNNFYEKFNKPMIEEKDGTEDDDELEFDIIATTGQIDVAGRNLVNIDSHPSINYFGYVAFIGKVKGEKGNLQNIYVYNPHSQEIRPLMHPILEYLEEGETPTQTFTFPQINNQNKVIARRYLTAKIMLYFSLVPIPQIIDGMPVTSIEVWDGNKTVLPIEQISSGHAGLKSTVGLLNFIFVKPIVGGVYPSKYNPFSHWIGVYHHYSINNYGKTVFTAWRKGDENYVSTTIKPPFHYNNIQAPGVPWVSIADNGYVIAHVGEGNNGNLYHVSYNYSSIEVIASADNKLFSYIGKFPGISDNGNYVVFYGVMTEEGAKHLKTTPGPGIFVRNNFNSQIYRINGLSGNGYLDPGETYEDKNENGQFDSEIDVDKGSIINLYSDKMVCINNSGYIIYLANNVDKQKAIFRSHIDFEDDSYDTVPIYEPFEIAAVGSTLDGKISRIQDINIYDSLSDKDESGDIVFWAKTANKQTLIVARGEQKCPVCLTCSELGTCDVNLSSVDVKIGLGKDSRGKKIGYLAIKATSPSEKLAKPESLIFSGGRDFIQVKKDGQLRQIKTPQGIAEIDVENDFKYHILFYAEIGNKDSETGLYSHSETPFSTITVENPDSDYNSLKITRNISEVYTYLFYEDTNSWELLSGIANAVRKETLKEDKENDTRIVIRTIKDKDDNILSKEKDIFQTFAWGEELIQSIDDPDDKAKTTRYTYYEDKENDDSNYGKLRKIEYSNGNWEFFKEYSLKGIVLKSVAQFKNNPYSETTEWPDPENRSSEIIFNGELTTDLEYLKGKLISKRWRKQEKGGVFYSVVATSPSITDWNDPSNLITKTFTYTSSNIPGGKTGRIHKTINSNGTMTLFQYYNELIENPFSEINALQIKVKRTVTFSGEPNEDKSTIVKGTRTETIFDKSGNFISRKVFDIETDLLIDAEYVVEKDKNNRPTRTQYLDGTYITHLYGCCGLEQKTDREGVVTYYNQNGTVSLDLDKDGVLEEYAGSSETHAGISNHTLIDAMGRSFKTVIEGTDGSLIIQSEQHYNKLGDLEWSKDALGCKTFYSEREEDDFIIRTTTLPDGSKKIETYYQDDSLYQITGNASPNLRYTYDIELDNGSWAQTTTQTYIDKDGNPTGEYIKTYNDFAGRNYKTEYPGINGDEPSLTLNFYNNKGQLVKIVQPDGETTLYQYNGLGDRELTVLDVDRNSEINFNGKDRISRTTSFYENSSLRGTVIQKSLSEVWEINGKDKSSILQITEKSVDGSKSWITQYELTTNILTEVDRGNQRRTVTTINPDKTKTIVIYEKGLQKSVMNLDSNDSQLMKKTYIYDTFSRLWKVTDVRNGTTIYTYYDNGQIRTETTPDPEPGSSGIGKDAQTITYTYFNDKTNGIKRVIQLPDGGTVTQEFFPTGQAKKIYGARTYPVEFTYDYANRMKTMTTWQDFDFNAGKGTSGSAITTWNYNLRGLLKSKIYDDGKGTNYTYTPGGKLYTRTWARGIVTTYNYNNAGDLKTVIYSDNTPNIAYTYDRRGRQKTITDASGSRTLGYMNGIMNTEAYISGNFAEYTLTRGLDRNNRLASLSLLNQKKLVYNISYDYDQASRLKTVKSENQTAIYSYHPNSNLIHTLTLNNGEKDALITTRKYDNLNRLTSISSHPLNDSPVSFKYQYNDADHRTKVTLADGKYWKYGYDNLGQVISGIKYLEDGTPIPGYTYGYSFDKIGNRLSASREKRTDIYQSNKLNQIDSINNAPFIHIQGSANIDVSVKVNSQESKRLSEYFYGEVPISKPCTEIYIEAKLAEAADEGNDAIAEKQGHFIRTPGNCFFTYDDDGNMIRDDRWIYKWNGENRLVEMKTQLQVANEGVPWVKLEFSYDSQGRRISKKVYEFNESVQCFELKKTINFIYDGWNLISEKELKDNEKEIVKHYVWGLDLSGTLQGAGGVGGLIISSTYDDVIDQIFYPIIDGNGNIVAIIDKAGNNIGEYSYSPFGKIIKHIGLLSQKNSFTFSSKYTDSESNMFYYGYRYYYGEIGRWLSRDPVEEKNGSRQNSYIFVRNNIIRLFDAFGLKAEEVIIKGTGAGLLGREITLRGKVAVRLSGTDLYVTGRPQPGMWMPPDGSTSSLLIYQKSNPKKHFRLDYHAMPNKGYPKPAWHYNVTKGFAQIKGFLKGTKANTDHLVTWGSKLSGKTITIFRWGGRALVIAGAAMSVYDVYHAKNKAREITRQVSGWAGAIALAKYGAAGGTKLGATIAVVAGQLGPQVGLPEEMVTVPAGSLIGSAVGAVGGATIGWFVGTETSEVVFDWIFIPLEKEEWIIYCSANKE